MILFDLESMTFAVSYRNLSHDDFDIYKLDLLGNISKVVQRINELTYTDNDVTFYLDEGKSFRFQKNETYKSDRKEQTFKYRKELKEFAKNELKALSVPLLEADDLIGINSSFYNLPIIASIDNDFLTLPNIQVYNYKRDFLLFNDNISANLKLATKMLTGGHNYSVKLEGVGPKTADNYLAQAATTGFYSTINFVKQAYSHGISKEICGRNIKPSTIENFFNSFRENYILRNVADIFINRIEINKNPINENKMEVEDINELYELHSEFY